MQIKRNYIKLIYAAIRRYGSRSWVICDGVIDFRPTYLVSISHCEYPQLDTEKSEAYIAELSNGTKFLFYAEPSYDSEARYLIHEDGSTDIEDVCRWPSEEENDRLNQYLYLLNGPRYEGKKG